LAQLSRQPLAANCWQTEEHFAMTEEVILKVGLTPKHQCSYLGHEQEQLLVLMDHSCSMPAATNAC
jgi:hypothetical protein